MEKDNLNNIIKDAFLERELKQILWILDNYGISVIKKEFLPLLFPQSEDERVVSMSIFLILKDFGYEYHEIDSLCDLAKEKGLCKSFLQFLTNLKISRPRICKGKYVTVEDGKNVTFNIPKETFNIKEAINISNQIHSELKSSMAHFFPYAEMDNL